MVAMRAKDDGDGRGWLVLLLTGLFVGLRLGGVTHWAWVWIFVPLWLPMGLALAGMITFAGTGLTRRR